MPICSDLVPTSLSTLGKSLINFPTLKMNVFDLPFREGLAELMNKNGATVLGC